MAILIACERSQRVCTAFRRVGIEAFSCDIVETDGDFPAWHIVTDVRNLLSQPWDGVIAFPPCTHLASSGARHFAAKRADGRQQEAADFFLEFTRLSCPWAIENPVGIMSTVFRKPDQIVQPWQYAGEPGEMYSKSTCLWLNKLPPLRPLRTEPPAESYHTWTDASGRQKRQTAWCYKTRCMPASQRGTAASVTPQGLAEAMAAQWAPFFKNALTNVGNRDIINTEASGAAIKRTQDCEYYADHGGKVGHCNIGRYKAAYIDYHGKRKQGVEEK